MTNEVHSIFSNHGTYLLKKYVTLLQNGGSKKHKGKYSLRGRKTEAQRKKQFHKQKNVITKRLDKKQKKKKEKLKRFLEQFRAFISDSPNSADFEENVLEPILQTAFMTPEEIQTNLIQNKKFDKFVKYLNFSRELKNSGAWLGKGTPIAMIQTAVNSKTKSLFIRALLFITAIILAVNTVITYIPEDMVRKIGDNSANPTEIAKYDNKQWNFYDESQWGSFRNIRDEELRNSIADLSGRPGLLYDTNNLEFVMKALDVPSGESSSEEEDEEAEEAEVEAEEAEVEAEEAEESSDESSEDMLESTQ